ncbi:Ig-like domain-containing protein [Rarobacter incanus]|uniref:Ig-like domain-containing protein n=1 Tax=Rarobacter incanus TaxID=153494 RepID=A0A542SQB7_9MICO|nr:Ig-like domain-containing protein [Rarobacter incanus]TQK76803.1 Ig-like domain-containing protein [Rarobacter incanus]
MSRTTRTGLPTLPRWQRLLAIGCATAIAGVGLTVPAAAQAAPADVTFPATDGTDTPLESDILKAVEEADFSSTYDFDTETISKYTPQVDVAVIELDEQGKIRDRANIIVSRDYPNGVVAPIDSTMSSSSVNWIKWDQSKFDGTNYGTGTSIVEGREDAPLRYMSSYPASLLKSMVAFGMVFLADHDVINFSDTYTYNGVTKSITQWTSEMIQYSNNTSASAMIKMLHEVQYNDQSGIDFLNSELAKLGLSTLQLKGTSASTGGGWSNGGVTMTSFDTARLDLLLDGGGTGVLWTTPDGLDVTSSILSDEGRQWLLDIWSGTAYHWMLDTGNFCNWTTPYTGESQYPSTGIPAVVPESTLNANGTSKIAWAGSPFASIDVRPCNEKAEVTYYNKYGLTYNAGADAGIVKALPGKPYRHYIISVMTNIGYRYGDAALAATGNACLSNESSFCYTEKLPIMAGKIDAAIKARGTEPAKATTKTALALSADSITYPQTVTATATVDGAASGATVDLYDGDTLVKSGTTDAEGKVTFTYEPKPGTSTLVAKYEGDSSTFTSSSSAQSLEVAKGDPKFALTVTGAEFGSSPTAVVSLADDATGTVDFLVNGDEFKNVPVAGGKAELVLADLGVGAYPVQASYSGSDFYEAAQGLSAVAITKAGTVTSLSAPTTVYGNSATVVAAVSPAATGSVDFTIDGQPAGTVDLTGGKAQISAIGLSVGSHVLSATFTGSDNYTQSFGVTTLKVTKAAVSSIEVKATKTKKGKKTKVKVVVGKLTNGSVATGKVAIKVGKKTVKTVKLRKKNAGKVTVTLTKSYSKKAKISVKFTPQDSASVKAKKSAKVKVKRK